MKHEIIQMLAQGGGAIVNTASGAALIPAPGQPHYTAAKRGVLGLTTYAADELNNKGIRVNAICPGMIDTPMVASWRESSPEMAEAVIQMMPGGRLGAARRGGRGCCMAVQRRSPLGIRRHHGG